MQYPVMPWVIADYTSESIGIVVGGYTCYHHFIIAFRFRRPCCIPWPLQTNWSTQQGQTDLLQGKRRHLLLHVLSLSHCCQERYSEMTSNKFLYGTHYSAPGYVLYYLVRKGKQLLASHRDSLFQNYNPTSFTQLQSICSVFRMVDLIIPTDSFTGQLL